MTAHLADFIHQQAPAILAEWQRYVQTLQATDKKPALLALPGQAEQVLAAIEGDLRRTRTRAQSLANARQLAARRSGTAHNAAEAHALLRAAQGFTLEQLVAEYRALRASVLDLWAESQPTGPHVVAEIGRFNEAIDQAVLESVALYTQEVERWRAVFLGVLTHELRGPLNAVLLSSQLVQHQAKDTPASLTADRLLRSAQRMRGLLDDLLEFNRSVLGLGLALRRMRGDLALAVQEEVELRRSTLPGVTIELSIEAPCIGEWDASRMKQVVGNLVANAAQHGAWREPIHVCLQRYEEGIKLSVENVGPTIPLEVQLVIFDPLRRVGSQGDQTSMGLGLFITREIVHAHGGTIAVQSGDGRTVFSVILPRLPA